MYWRQVSAQAETILSQVLGGRVRIRCVAPASFGKGWVKKFVVVRQDTEHAITRMSRGVVFTGTRIPKGAWKCDSGQPHPM